MTINEANETCDSILGGRIRVIQPRKGYRFSVDALLVARFVRVRARDRVLELGAGSGVVSMCVAALYGPREVVALEMEPALVAMARRGAELNGLGSMRAIAADLRERRIQGIAANSFDLVIANPPYRAVATGRQSPIPARRVARSEAEGTLEDFVSAAGRYARHRGSAAFVFLAERSAELLATMRAHRLEPKRIRFVHPRADRAATAVLVEARKGGGTGVEVEPPLILYARERVYTDEARAMLGGAEYR
jgi:tRNA1Val (adenine37-N6)-methyltransferase